MRKRLFARGKRGVVSTGFIGKRKVAIKERNARSVVDTIAHESRVLRIVNARGIGPTFLAYESGALYMEFIDGERMLEWIAHARRRAIVRAMRLLLTQCRTLDTLGLNKRELTHPDKHVLIRKGVPVQIDFERCTYAREPKNVTQLVQWLTSTRVHALLLTRRIDLDHAGIRAAAAAYKKERSDTSFQALEALFGVE